jgi:superfamily I DNA/RNA helicase
MIVQPIKFDSLSSEIEWITNQLRIDLKNKGLNDIAIIARKHKYLEAFALNLNNNNIPFRYERNQDVLKMYHIEWIIAILTFVSTLHYEKDDFAYKEELLPDILCFPFWEIPQVVIYDLSVKAFQDRQTWLKIMLSYECSIPTLEAEEARQQSYKIRNIANLFLDMAGKSRTQYTLGQMLDWILGVNQKGEYHRSKRIEEESYKEDFVIEEDEETEEVYDSEFYE